MAEKKAAELQNRLARTEDLLQKATKDFILARTTPYILEEQQALLEFELSKLSGERKDMQKTIDDAKKDATAVAKAEAESYVNQFKDQMQRRSAIATQYEKRIRELEATTKATKKKMKQLQQRRTMDLEGFTADVTTTSSTPLRRGPVGSTLRGWCSSLWTTRARCPTCCWSSWSAARRTRAGLDVGASRRGGGGVGRRSPNPRGTSGASTRRAWRSTFGTFEARSGRVEDRLTESKIAAANDTLDDDDDDEGGGCGSCPRENLGGGGLRAKPREHGAGRDRRGRRRGGAAGGAAGHGETESVSMMYSF